MWALAVESTGPALPASVVRPAGGRRGKTSDYIPSNIRSIGPEWGAHRSGRGAANLCPFSADFSSPRHQGMKFKLLLQTGNSILWGTDVQCSALLVLFLMSGKVLPSAAKTAESYCASLSPWHCPGIPCDLCASGGWPIYLNTKLCTRRAARSVRIGYELFRLRAHMTCVLCKNVLLSYYKAPNRL